MSQQRSKAFLSAPQGLGEQPAGDPIHELSEDSHLCLVQLMLGPGEQMLPQVWRPPSVQPSSITSNHEAQGRVECVASWWPSAAAAGMQTHSSSTRRGIKSGLLREGWRQRDSGGCPSCHWPAARWQAARPARWERGSPWQSQGGGKEPLVGTWPP